MKGFYLATYAWMEGRDINGWRLNASEQELEDEMEDWMEEFHLKKRWKSTKMHNQNEPNVVEITPLLIEHTSALRRFFQSKLKLMRLI